MTPDRNDLFEYRLKQLEDAQMDLAQSHRSMNESMVKLVAEFKAAKWVIGSAFAIVQPIVVTLIVKLVH